MDEDLGDKPNRQYWYSVTDAVRLLIFLRKQHLTYNNDAKFGEQFHALRQNSQRIFLSDPYHSSNFQKYLSDDLTRIMGFSDKDKNNFAWASIPLTIIIPFLSGMHWRAIRIKINESDKSFSLLWDDPFGNNGFHKALFFEVMEILKKELSHFMSINEKKITTIIKEIDQQGKTLNDYDCGPIIFKNIDDYLKFQDTSNEIFIQNNHYSIPAFSNINDHDQIIQEVRKMHIKASKSVLYDFEDIEFLDRKKFFDNDRLLIREKTQKNDFTNGKINENTNPLLIDLFFTIIENYRLFNQKFDNIYTKEEIDYAYDYALKEFSKKTAKTQKMMKKESKNLKKSVH